MFSSSHTAILSILCPAAQSEQPLSHSLWFSPFPWHRATAKYPELALHLSLEQGIWLERSSRKWKGCSADPGGSSLPVFCHLLLFRPHKQPFFVFQCQEEFSDYEANDPWVQQFIVNLEQQMTEFKVRERTWQPGRPPQSIS